MRNQIMFFNHLFILYLLLGLLVTGDVLSGDKPPRGRIVGEIEFEKTIQRGDGDATAQLNEPHHNQTETHLPTRHLTGTAFGFRID